MTLKVGDAPAELRAAVLAMRRADKYIRSDVSGRLRATMGPEWREQVTQHLSGAGRMEARMLLPGTRIKAGNPPALVAASSSRRVGNGLVPNRHAAGYEFGAADSTRAMRSKKGKRYTRHVMRHLPARNPRGRVVYPAAARFLPRVASFWVQSVVRAFMDAADGGRR